MSSRHEHNDGYSTRSIHVGSEPDPVTGALAPNLTVSTTFKFRGLDETTGYEYGRAGNPTRTELESLLTSLETCPSSHTSDCSHKDISGGDAVVFSSGSAATAAMCHWAALATEEGGAGGRDGNNHGGGHILAVNDVYGGTARMLSRTVKPLGVETTFINFAQAGEAGIRKALRPDTKIVWLECPTNPLLLVPPIPLIVKIIDSLPDRPLLLVDTTFLSSFYFNPLVPVAPNAEPLADVVMSSLTKYSGGHTDIIMGALVASERGIKKFPNIIKGLRFLQNSLGGTASPRDCHLMIRSIKTLSVRMIRHGLNALRLAAWLNAHEAVQEVRYPGLRTDAAFHMVEQLISENAKRELRFLGWTFPFESSQSVFDPNSLDAVRTLGIPFGGMINFKLHNATAQQTAKFVGALRLNVLAVSLGGVESLLEVPDSMTHAELPVHIKAELGITPNLVRVSVGLEDVEDLMEDLNGAFRAMQD